MLKVLIILSLLFNSFKINIYGISITTPFERIYLFTILPITALFIVKIINTIKKIYSSAYFDIIRLIAMLACIYNYIEKSINRQ